MNILYLYNATQTYTNTLYEHLAALATFSSNRAFFMHAAPDCEAIADLSRFDAVCVHYSIRLPFDQISPGVVSALQGFDGLKFLFIQDEYDNTHRAWHWIKTVGFQLVFTVVPDEGIARVYPPEEFPSTKFVTNLTGYVPFTNLEDAGAMSPPSHRPLVIGYRGRPLPVRYGALGFEKVEIGRMVRKYCEEQGIASDIAWTEEARIYGPDWSVFMRSCRAMLGSESGSNVFDWDGQLPSRIDEFKKQNPHAKESEIYDQVIKPLELDGLMNQVSPRVFEAIAAKTVLVLFEGTYSGVVKPDEHFIPLKKDGSNLAEVFAKLADANYVDAMAERAYRDVVGSGRFGFPAFVEFVDREVESSLKSQAAGKPLEHEVRSHCVATSETPAQITTMPSRPDLDQSRPSFLWELAVLISDRLPEPITRRLHPIVRRVKGLFVPESN